MSTFCLLWVDDAFIRRFCTVVRQTLKRHRETQSFKQRSGAELRIDNIGKPVSSRVRPTSTRKLVRLSRQVFFALQRAHPCVAELFYQIKNPWSAGAEFAMVRRGISPCDSVNRDDSFFRVEGSWAMHMRGLRNMSLMTF